MKKNGKILSKLNKLGECPPRAFKTVRLQISREEYEVSQKHKVMLATRVFVVADETSINPKDITVNCYRTMPLH